MAGVTTCGICCKRIEGYPAMPGDEPTAYYGNGFARHEACEPMTEIDRVMQQTGMDRMQAHYHVQARTVLRERTMATTHRINMGGAERIRADREAELIRLRTQSPLRSAAGQSDAAHLPLFVTANEPTLF